MDYSKAHSGARQIKRRKSARSFSSWARLPAESFPKTCREIPLTFTMPTLSNNTTRGYCRPNKLFFHDSSTENIAGQRAVIALDPFHLTSLFLYFAPRRCAWNDRAAGQEKLAQGKLERIPAPRRANGLNGRHNEIRLISVIEGHHAAAWIEDSRSRE